MKRRSTFATAGALFAAILLTACGGSATTAPTVGAVPTVPAVAVPTVPAVAVPTIPAVAIPTLPPGASVAPPTIAPDNDLAAKFPKSIDGQPVGTIQTGTFLSSLQGFNIADAAIAQVRQSFSAAGLDFDTLSSGSADYTVDGNSVRVDAIRTPGNDGNKLIQGYAVIIGAFGALFGSTPPPPPTFTQGNVGGKNVTIATDPDGSVTTLYVSGDTVFSVNDVTDSQTTKIMAALP